MIRIPRLRKLIVQVVAALLLWLILCLTLVLLAVVLEDASRFELILQLPGSLALVKHR